MRSYRKYGQSNGLAQRGGVVKSAREAAPSSGGVSAQAANFRGERGGSQVEAEFRLVSAASSGEVLIAESLGSKDQ